MDTWIVNIIYGYMDHCMCNWIRIHTLQSAQLVIMTLYHVTFKEFVRASTD